MERLTPQQSLQIVQLCYENGRSMKSVYYRALRPIYGVHNRPTERTIRHTIAKLENNLTLLDDTRLIRPRTAITSIENNRLMLLMGWRIHWPIFLQRRGWRQCNSQWGTLSRHDKRLFDAGN